MPPVSADDIGFLIDLGIVLREASPAAPQEPLELEPLRRFCSSSEHAGASLIDLLADPKLRRILMELDRALSPSLGLAAAPLFLKWKHAGQRAERLDIAVLRADVETAAARLDSMTLRGAIWMTGLFFGFPYFAADCHARSSAGCIRAGARLVHKPVALPAPATASKTPRKPRGRKAAAKPAPVPADEPASTARQQELIS